MLVLIAAFTVVLSGDAAGGKLAQIPAADGVIHGCYVARTGFLRVIDPAVESCRATELPLAWNQQGPAGPAGPVGPAGPAGASGLANYEVVTAQATNTAAIGVIYEIDATCTAGKRPTGGGWRQDPVLTNGVQLTVEDSYPTTTGWHVHAYLRPNLTVFVYAICASTAPQ